MLVSSDLKTLETNCAVQSQHFRGLRPVPAGLSAASANLAKATARMPLDFAVKDSTNCAL